MVVRLLRPSGIFLAPPPFFFFSKLAATRRIYRVVREGFEILCDMI